MKFGVREICDVVLRAKAAQKIGNKVFYKNEPVLYFDSLKTSTLEGAATTVYAQGGRGNSRLIAWEGERTVTFTMEDALISPMGFSVLTGAGLVDAEEEALIVHKTEQVVVDSITGGNTPTSVTIKISEQPYTGKTGTTYAKASAYTEGQTYYQDQYGLKVAKGVTNDNVTNYYVATPTYAVDNNEDFIYVMLLDDNGEIVSEPYIAQETGITPDADGKYTITIAATDANSDNTGRVNDLSKFTVNSVVLVDYYVKRNSGAFQIDITPDKFGGNFYLEASTLFRATNGVDMPAEFIIPNCKIQSNFTFTMASSGDPSTFTFTMDAFPDYTRWNKTKKVYAAIQVLEESDTLADFERLGTAHDQNTAYNTSQKPWIEI